MRAVRAVCAAKVVGPLLHTVSMYTKSLAVAAVVLSLFVAMPGVAAAEDRDLQISPPADAPAEQPHTPVAAPDAPTAPKLPVTTPVAETPRIVVERVNSRRFTVAAEPVAEPVAVTIVKASSKKHAKKLRKKAAPPRGHVYLRAELQPGDPILRVRAGRGVYVLWAAATGQHSDATVVMRWRHR